MKDCNEYEPGTGLEIYCEHEHDVYNGGFINGMLWGIVAVAILYAIYRLVVLWLDRQDIKKFIEELEREERNRLYK